MSRFSAYIYDKYIFNWNCENGVLIKKCSLFVPPSEPHFDFPTSKGLKITPSDKTRAKLKNLSLVIMAWSCIEENDNIFFLSIFWVPEIGNTADAPNPLGSQPGQRKSGSLHVPKKV